MILFSIFPTRNVFNFIINLIFFAYNLFLEAQYSLFCPESAVKSKSVNQYQIMLLLHRLHWLRAPERISFKQGVLVFRCLKGFAPTYYLTDKLHVTDLPGRQRLRSASSIDLAVPQTRL